MSKFSVGAELELSDIDRSVDIPIALGRWEGPKKDGYYMGAEIDIVNTLGEDWGKGTDPLCQTVHVGGEINTQPSYSPEVQTNRLLEIINLFPHCEVGSVNHTHIHTFMEGLAENVELLKNVFEYTKLNEVDTMKACYGWTPEIDTAVMNSRLPEWCKTYLHWDGCRRINPVVYEKVAEATSVQEILNILETYNCYHYCWVRDGWHETESHRTAINLFNLTKGKTIEFRCFRGTKDPYEFYSSLIFVQRYMEEALKGASGKPVVEILKEANFKFAIFDWNEGQIGGWAATRHKKGRGDDYKHYSGTVVPSEDIFVSYNNIIEDIKKRFYDNSN